MYNQDNDLFNDGWREPGDDAHRLGIYAMSFAAVPAGLFMVYVGILALTQGELPFSGNDPITDPASVNVMGWLSLAAGLAIGGMSVYFLWKESKHWNLRQLTWDKFIAGGMLLGIGLMWVGLRSMPAGQNPAGAIYAMAGLFALGFADIVLFLLLGLIIAYWPAIMNRRRTLKNVRIEERCGLNDKLYYVPNHPCPEEDGLEAVVTLQTVDRKTLKLIAASNAYALAEPGIRGHAIVKGKRLVGFKPLMRNGMRQ